MEKSRPRVIISAAMSVDGRIATRTGESGLSSRADLRRLHLMRAKTDAILVGIGTVCADDPMLSVRLVSGKNPVRIILDSAGSISQKSRIMRTCKKIPTIIAVSQRAPKRNTARLQALGAETIPAGRKRIGLRALLGALQKRGIGSVLVEGGGEVIWEFLRAGLYDEIVLAVSPVIIGGTDSVPLAAGRGPGRISELPRLRLLSAKRLGCHLVLRYEKD